MQHSPVHSVAYTRTTAHHSTPQHTTAHAHTHTHTFHPLAQQLCQERHFGQGASKLATFNDLQARQRQLCVINVMWVRIVICTFEWGWRRREEGIEYAAAAGRTNKKLENVAWLDCSYSRPHRPFTHHTSHITHNIWWMQPLIIVTRCPAVSCDVLTIPFHSRRPPIHISTLYSTPLYIDMFTYQRSSDDDCAACEGGPPRQVREGMDVHKARLHPCSAV